MNRDFVDTDANVAPVENQHLDLTPQLNAPQNSVQKMLASESKLSECDQAPSADEPNQRTTGQVVPVHATIPPNAANKEKLEKVQAKISESGNRSPIHETPLEVAAPIPHDPAPTVQKVGQQDLKVAECTTVFKSENDASVPPASVDVLQAERKDILSNGSDEPSGNSLHLPHEPAAPVTNPVPIANIENPQREASESSVAVADETNRSAENIVFIAESRQALPDRFQDLIVDDDRAVTELKTKQEDDERAQLPVPAGDVSAVVAEAANQEEADNAGSDVRDPAPPSPIVLPEEVRADQVQPALEPQLGPRSPYIPDISPNEEYIRRFAENASRYRSEDEKDFPVDAHSFSQEILKRASFGLDPRLYNNLRALGITEKRPVQSRLIRAIFARDNTVVQTETGSGKTIGYVVPIIERAIRRATTFGRGPLAVVLVPTHETCNRVAKLFSTLASGTSVKIAFSYGGADFKFTRDSLGDGCDVLVCTSARFFHHLTKRQIVLSDLQTVIVDCAEQMIGDSCTSSTIIGLLKVHPRRSEFQVVLISTTYDSRITSFYCRRLEPIMDISTGRNLNQRVDVTTVAVKNIWSEGIRVINQIVNEPGVRQILIITKTNETCAKLHKWLRRRHELQEYWESIHYVTDMASQERRDQTVDAFWRGQFKCLITTDSFVVGLDFPDVERVISFDMPSSPELLVHRCGKTGRVVNGKASVFLNVRAKDRREQAKILKTFLRQEGKEIPEWLQSV